jgi:hypothetical protein
MDSFIRPIESIASSSFTSAAIAAVVAGLVSYYLGPIRIIREEKARRTLAVRDEVVRALQLLLRHLRNVELENQKVNSGGQATVRWTIKDYERILWPVVRALENPDISRRLVKRLRPALKELLGSWRIDYLSICVSEDLENALDRYPFQPLHLKEPVSILERLCAPDLAVVTEAVSRVEKTLALIR